MTDQAIGVAVIGAGMAGRAHLAGYRVAPTLFEAGLPPVEHVAVADVAEDVAKDAAARWGYRRHTTDWREVVEADDVDVVSVVGANHLHREIVEVALAAGKHVLCEKPLAPSVADAQAMVDVSAAHPELVAATGFTYRRQPAVAAIREQVGGALGEPVHLIGSYLCDYGLDPRAPMTWRSKGGPGSGALSDIGSHLIDLAEFLLGPIRSVSGAVFSTAIAERAVPVGTTYGHALAELSDRLEPVENEDVATFTASFASGASGTFSTSRIAAGHANSLSFELYGTRGAAKYDMDRTSEFSFIDSTVASVTNGFRQVLIGPEHPYISRGLPMDFPGVGFGVNDLFAFQARAMLEQVAGIDGLPRCAPLADGLRNLRVISAVAASAAAGGAGQTIA